MPGKGRGDPGYRFHAIDAEKRPVRVIVVTTYARPGYLTRARTANVSGYLLKVAPAAELITAIRIVHRGGIVIPADLAEAAREAGTDPLTDREREVLRLEAVMNLRQSWRPASS